MHSQQNVILPEKLITKNTFLCNLTCGDISASIGSKYQNLKVKEKLVRKLKLSFEVDIVKVSPTMKLKRHKNSKGGPPTYN